MRNSIGSLRYDMYGRKINQNKFHSVMFLYFSDGTVEKKINIE